MSQPTNITCEAISDSFEREAGRIGLPTYYQGLRKDPILRFAVQGQFPDGMGVEVNTVISRRSEATGSGWADVGSSTDEDNACLPPVKKVSYAADKVSYKLQQQAIESDYLCLEDLRTGAITNQQVADYIRMLGENVTEEFIQKYTDDYYEFSDNKVVCAPGMPSDDADFPSTEPTSSIDMSHLEWAYDRLERDNAGADGDAVDDNGAPVFNVFADRLTINNLIKGNEDIRQDVRWSDRVNDLLGPMGGSLLPAKSYSGLTFHNSPFTKRYNDDGAGGYTEVPKYITTAAGNGNLKSILNPAYLNAKYNSAYIFHPRAVEWMVPNPNLKIGGITYGPQNYRGEYRWINEYDKSCNPDLNQGYWRAVMKVAPKPIFVEWSYVFLFLNCSVAGNFTACPAGTGYISA